MWADSIRDIANLEKASRNAWIEGHLYSRSDLMLKALQTCPETYRVADRIVVLNQKPALRCTQD